MPPKSPVEKPPTCSDEIRAALDKAAAKVASENAPSDPSLDFDPKAAMEASAQAAALGEETQRAVQSTVANPRDVDPAVTDLLK